MALDARLVAIVVIVVAVAGPLLAYAVYPGEPPIEDIEGDVPAFVRAVSHCRVYGGIATISGRVVEASPPILLVEGGDGRLYRIVLGNCWSSREAPPVDYRIAPGTTITVEGSIYVMHGVAVVKPHKIIVDGQTYVRTSECPEEAIAPVPPMPHHCPMCPHP